MANQQAQTPKHSSDKSAESAQPVLGRWRTSGSFDRNYKEIIVVISALVTVLAGAVAYLETWTSNHYSASVRQGQALAMDALGYDMSTRQQESYDAYLYAAWNEWDWRHARAQGIDEALAARSAEVAAAISPMTILLDPNQPYLDPDTYATDRYAYHVDTNVITTTILLEERTFAIETANVWNGKADGFVSILTVIAVALFLYGLSATLEGKLRYLFAAVGSLLVGLALVATGVLVLRPVPDIPEEAIAEYARGVGLSYRGEYDQAHEAYAAALRIYPGYGNAYYERAEVALWQADYERARDDYLLAAANGRDDRSTSWELGWTYYLLGDYEASIRAGQRALALDPGLLPVVINVGFAYLAKGDTEMAMGEIERALRLASALESTVPAAWNQFYLAASVQDLERLIAALDGETGFEQEPDLSNVQDRAALRAAAAKARLRLKEGMVELQIADLLPEERASAELSTISFGRAVGRNGELVGQGDTFARGERAVMAQLAFDHLPQGSIVSRRVARHWADEPGAVEALPTMGEDIVWAGEPQGTWQHILESPWAGDRGLLPGRYAVEYYVDGRLLQSANLTVPEEETAIIGPIVFATECGSGGRPYGPSRLFPEGLPQVSGAVQFSGIPAGSPVRAQWYRDGAPYESSELVTESHWGSLCYSLYSILPGAYRLELNAEGLKGAVQSAGFEVLSLERYLDIVGTESEDWRFHFDLGNAYASLGDYSEAAARYQRATELEPACAPCHHRWWEILYQQERYGEAVEKLQRAIELNPAQYSYLADLGQTYYWLGDEAAATNAFRQAIHASPAYAYNAWGNTLFALERYEEAVAKYRQSIELNPEDKVVHANLGGAFQELGDYDQAQAACKQAILLNPDYARAYNLWGDTLYYQEQYLEATEKYQQAVERAPGEAHYHSNLGWAYYKAGEYGLSAAAFGRAVKLDPGRASDHNKWGDALYAQQQYDQAAERYQAAIDLAPDQALYHANLGWAYLNMEEFDLAAAAFRQAVELDPAQAEDWNMLGWALSEQGKYAEAIDAHLQAVARAPDVALYHYNLAWNYAQLGEKEQAIAAFEQTAELAAAEGDEELRQMAEDKLQELR